jgi:hypothetical protein
MRKDYLSGAYPRYFYTAVRHRAIRFAMRGRLFVSYEDEILVSLEEIDEE